MGAADNFNLIQATSSGPGGAAFLSNYRVLAGVQSIQVLIRTDAGGNVEVGRFPIADVAQLHCYEWRASSGLDDGFLRFYIDGVLQGSADFVDNDQHDVDSIILGAIAALDAGTSGTIFFDNIRWSNQML
jgi:hypothetical protein